MLHTEGLHFFSLERYPHLKGIYLLEMHCTNLRFTEKGIYLLEMHCTNLGFTEKGIYLLEMHCIY